MGSGKFAINVPTEQGEMKMNSMANAMRGNVGNIRNLGPWRLAADMPDDMEEILAIIPGFSNKGRVITNPQAARAHGATYWMPLPEPPQ